MKPVSTKSTARMLVVGVMLIVGLSLAGGAPLATEARAEPPDPPSVPHLMPRSARPPQQARPATRQPARQAPAPEDTIRERVNAGVVGLASARVGGTYALLASEMAIVLEQDDDLRIIPMITKGSVQNIRDLLYLRGVDIAIVQSDVLEFLEDQQTYDNIKKNITYIAPLYPEEFHLVGSKDIASLEDLAGKKVNFGEVGSGGAITASLIFRKLKIQVEPVNMAPTLGYEAVKSGEIAATVYVSGKPNQGIAALRAEDGFRLIPVPFSDALADVYLQSEFRSEDYPKLIPAGERIETAAVSSVLAAYNWSKESERYQRVSRFVEAFFTKLPTLQQSPFHPKWKEVDPAAKLPGWTRMSAARDMIEQGGSPREETSAVPR